MDIYIVKSGDTIFSIAQEYGTSPQRLIADNGLFGLPNLVVGQSLIILKPTLLHTVQAGETLFSISEIYGTNPLRLILNNPYLIFSYPRPGEILAIEFDNQTDKQMNVFGYVYPFINQNLLNVQSAYSTSVAVFSYGFNTDGTLITTNDELVLPTIKRWNASPIVVLSSIEQNGNFQIEKTRVLFNDIGVQNTVINNMLSLMQDKGYTGIDLDFEFINPDDRDAYTAFVRNVRDTMSQYGYTVNVDLAPKISDTQQGTLYEGHNYTQLGIESDTVLLMTYEWGYTYGPPLAVAPVNKVREVVEYAVSSIDNEKIFLGIPNYGYDWLLPYAKGVTVADSIGNETAIRIAQRYGAEIKFDDASKSPFFNYYDESGRQHEVWFEDVRSIEAKYGLIDEFSLKGAGYWNYMRSFSQNWAYVNSKYRIIK